MDISSKIPSYAGLLALRELVKTLRLTLKGSAVLSNVSEESDLAFKLRQYRRYDLSDLRVAQNPVDLRLRRRQMWNPG